jgi:hypothetical protein
LSEITLPPSSKFPLEAITDPLCREQFLSTLQPLDHRSLGRVEVDQLMETMKLVMMAFGQKMASLETEMALRESRMENRLLQQDQEISQLRSELKIMKLEGELDKHKTSSDKMDKVIKLAKVMEGDEYRPYAVSNALKTCNINLEDDGLPKDYHTRLNKAKSNGFKWRNDVEPVKSSTRLKKLKEWEESFDSVELMGLSEILDQDYIFSKGKGAESAALLRLQGILNVNLTRKLPSSTRHNLYQKAVKLAIARGVLVKKNENKYESFVELYWPDQVDIIKLSIVKLFNERGLSLKTFKICTTQTVQPSPHAFPYEEGDVDEVDRWVGIRDGKYDEVVQKIIESYSKSSES